MAGRRKDIRNYKKYESINGYNSTSVAYDIQPSYAPQVPKQDDRKRQKQQKQQAKREAALLRHANNLHAFKIIAAISVVFMGCICLMGIHAASAKQRVSLWNYKEELATLKNENAVLASEIAEQVDLEVVKKEAITRLGMAEPQAYQVVYINVPKTSYTVQYSQEETKADDTVSLAGILDLLKRD